MFNGNLEAAGPTASTQAPAPFRYIITHVFFPTQLPKDADYTLENDLSLACAVCAAAHAYRTSVPQWPHITKMLDNLRACVQCEHLEKGHVASQLCKMQVGDILAFFVRSQNAALILTKREKCTLFESFETSPRADAVETTGGSLICRYPGSAVEISNKVFDDESFRFEIANFLSRPGAVDSDHPPPPPSSPQYITAVLSGILRCLGRTSDVPRITKHVRDNVGQWPPAAPGKIKGDWRRSPLWLLLRVALQLSVDRFPLGRASYKEFMLFLLCILARDPNNTTLSSDMLHLMSSKIFRRFGKLRTSIPDWLSEMALKTCDDLREILDARWKPLLTPPSWFRNPSQEELRRDTQLSLLNSREYISNALANSGRKSNDTPFHPSQHRRGTIDDFLSSDRAFFEEAYNADPDVTLYDVEQSVEHGIDDWVACVANVDEACSQLEILMDSYMLKSSSAQRGENLQAMSTALLTGIELFVALDKLIVKEVPMLVDYSPEIPVSFLEKLLLRKGTSLHRLSCAYQYLSARHHQSRPGWSLLSNEFTEDSFAVRYYDQSPPLQHLEARIRQDMVTRKVDFKLQEAASRVATCDVPQGGQEHISGRRIADGTDTFQSPLPALRPHAKVVVFELQCPPCIRIWRSAAFRVLHYFSQPNDPKIWASLLDHENRGNLLAHIPILQPYFIHREGPSLAFQMQFVYFYPGGSQPPRLHYAIQHPPRGAVHRLFIWNPKIYHRDKWISTSRLTFRDSYEYSSTSTQHISAAQVDTPGEYAEPLDESMALAHLRCGDSLRWLNILRGACNRTLDFHRHEVRQLLFQTAFQVGPLDQNTAEWIWHQELQDTTYCNVLLDELSSLFEGAETGPIDCVVMNTISLLLARVLASSPSEYISKRTIALLRSVCRKTFTWVQELSCDLAMAPMNGERNSRLWDMAAACRGTFDVDTVFLRKVLHSSNDVDALFSCALLMCTLRENPPTSPPSRSSFEQGLYLALNLEQVSRDAILTDASDYGIDLAVRMVFAGHKPSIQRWERLQGPNTRWITCNTKATQDQQSKTLCLDLLHGELRVDGQPLGNLLRAIRMSPQCEKIFCNGIFLVSSNLPGMDFTTLIVMSKYKVHFSLRGRDLVLQAQCNQTNDILEMIPPSVLQEDLPPALVFGHIHWLNLTTRIVEIRPLEQIWEQSVENWRIDCTSASAKYHMYNGRETFVDIRSPTWGMVSKCFEGLSNVHETGDPIVDRFSKSRWRCNDGIVTITAIDMLNSLPLLRLTVTLPRYGLCFFVNNSGELESRDFQDMVYDKDQSLGALLGLENLLILRQKLRLQEGIMPRRVIIPVGSLRKHGDHLVRISGSPDRSRRAFSTTRSVDLYHPVRYYTYEVNTDLDCLKGDGSLESTRYIAYLHAMTSCHRPDPLTSKTGLQAALALLQSAGCRSIAKPLCDVSHHTGTSARYPQINDAEWEIQHRYYWNRNKYECEAPDAQQKRALRRAACLSPWSSTGPTSPENCGDRQYPPVLESDIELENVTFAISSTTYRLSITDIQTAASNWAELWSKNVKLNTPAAKLPPHDIPKTWSSHYLVQAVTTRIQDTLEKREGNRQRFNLLFFFPSLAYGSPNQQAAFLLMLIAFAEQLQTNSDNLSNLSIHADCKFSDGYRPTEEILQDHILRCRIKEQRLNASSKKHDVDATIKYLLNDWPSNIPPTVSLNSLFWDVESLTTSLQQLFSSCYRNFSLKEYLVCFLSGSESPTTPHLISSDSKHVLNACMPFLVTLDQLLSNRPAPDLPPRTAPFCDTGKRHDKTSTKGSESIPALEKLFSSLRADHSIQREYIAHLDASVQHVCERSPMSNHMMMGKHRLKVLEKHHLQCRVSYTEGLEVLKRTLSPTANPYEQALSRLGQWPAITTDVLLRCLASTSSIKISPKWKKCLVSLALLLLDFQRSRRMLKLVLHGLEEEFLKESENGGCDGWNAEDYPDWLLIQVQGDFLIRRDQAETAIRMMYGPQSEENTVMQVNMGEGKSTVIIPIAAAALADGKQLVRVIVPKALTAQIFDLLVSRLGALANRPIYYLPFTRSAEYDLHGGLISLGIDDLQKLMSQCMAEHGILLVQPEHALSLKLMSVEEQTRKGKFTTNINILTRFFKNVTVTLSHKLLREDSLVGNVSRLPGQASDNPSKRDAEQNGNTLDNASKWLNLQKWIHSHVRDVLDESDEILHPRFQLIYTIGPQRPVDGYPERWTITQQVLQLTKRRAHFLSRCLPDSIEYRDGPPGSFPYIHIVRASGIGVGRDLMTSIVEDVMTGGLPSFNFQGIPQPLQDAIRGFISNEDVLPDTATWVREYAERSHHVHLWRALLLLRGLFALKILWFAFLERRWRVNYGLHPRSYWRKETLLAVPFRAKDVLIPNTQFGHTDTTIVLTCLSYYYAGLSKQQLRVAFGILLGQDDPIREYALWVEEFGWKSVPDSFQELGEINLNSSEKWDNTIFPLFRWNKATIDFYLSQVVFPKEAKEYPFKISGSSWDLAEKRGNVMTGFSGTNDSRWLLPLSVSHRDLDHQRGANVRVLAYLLQPENDYYIVIHENGEQCTTLGLLQKITTQQPQIRVLLDVGAQILDLSNLQVAKAWLDIVPSATAAVYFSENDELMLLTRNRTTQSMRSSPLSQQLDCCVVYLDHAHTRGTDLKLPTGSRAAVTLGPGVTKDSLVQGCMRMRKLGHGHSVMFFAPVEVDRSIRTVTGKRDPNVQITTVDILWWAIHETCADIKQRAPYWAQQGMSHEMRHEAWTRFCNGEIGPDKLSETWLQPDFKSLAGLYAPSDSQRASSTLSELDPAIRQRCKDLGVLSLQNAQLEEQQQREVHQEREREREVELPPRAEPAEHHLHPDVVEFVKTGVIPLLYSSSAFRPVFTSLDKSSAATRDADVWSPYILATVDFCETIKPESIQGTMDQYIRPVQWILSRQNVTDRDQVLVLLSPFEADRLMPDIRTSKHVHLHVYAPRTTKRMRPTDDLRLYTIPSLPLDWTPPWALIDQLNVFAGQLYLRDYQSYLRLCRFLGVPTKDSPSDGRVRWNLFNIPGSFEENEIRFSGSPLPCVMTLLEIRTRGRPFTETHMGKILQGQTLTERDFQRSTSIASASGSEPRAAPRDRWTSTCNTTPQRMHASCSDMEHDTGDDPGPRKHLRLDL